MGTLLAAGFWIAAAGCNDTTGIAGADAAVGLYTLRSVNGQLLPVVIDQQGSDISEITEGSVTLDADRTFEDITLLRSTVAGAVSTRTEAAAGNWTLSGSNVLFTPSDQSGPYEMTWDGGDQLTQNFNGLLLVYQR